MSGKADVARPGQKCPLLTQSGHYAYGGIGTRLGAISARWQSARLKLLDLACSERGTCGGASSSRFLAAQRLRGRSRYARSRANRCGASAYSWPSIRMTRKHKPASRLLWRVSNNWAGPSTATPPARRRQAQGTLGASSDHLIRARENHCRDGKKIGQYMPFCLLMARSGRT
jgi:hypothetical protein